MEEGGEVVSDGRRQKEAPDIKKTMGFFLFWPFYSWERSEISELLKWCLS